MKVNEDGGGLWWWKLVMEFVRVVLVVVVVCCGGGRWEKELVMVVELVRGEKSGGYGGWKNGHVREKKRGKENGFFLWFLCNDW